MTRRKKYWLIGGAIFVSVLVAATFIAASILAKRFDPMVREQAIRYLRDRFHADVQLSKLHIRPPKMSAIQILLRRGRGAKVGVDGEGLEMRLRQAEGLPPVFTIHKFRFQVDLGSLADDRKTVDSVDIDGMQITVPPRRKSSPAEQAGGPPPNVIIKHVRIGNALLTILPKDKDKNPLRFHIAHLLLDSVAPGAPMKYDASLTIPKPTGQAHSAGTFGPWNADEPGDTSLAGSYKFEHADLGVFNGISGILASTGEFDGSLSEIHARGQATVPDFRLKMAGNPVPLSTRFEVLVDGTNGNTVLKPVEAKLGETNFTTTGAVIKHEGDRRRSITLKVFMPDGDLRDLLRLATKGTPSMEGRIVLNTAIEIPPLSGRVQRKLKLDGRFKLRQARFLRANIQDQIDQLSRRGQGQPKNEKIDNVVSNMNGRFRLENQILTFRTLAFDAPGAKVRLHGNYDLARNAVDFHGSLALAAKVSQTMTGWKRWALKPVDPFFSKHGAGTFLRIKVEGPSDHPEFGLDRGGDNGSEQASNTQ